MLISLPDEFGERHDYKDRNFRRIEFAGGLLDGYRLAAEDQLAA